MIELSNQVQDAPMVRMQNAVLVSHCKFTLDQLNNNFNDANPIPEKMAQQLQNFSKAYDVLNAAYAVQQKSKETADIAALDQEGDQLISALKGMIGAAQRMSFDPERVAAAQSLGDTFAKYHVDATENLISEWSKMQQFVEEVTHDTKLNTHAERLGIDTLLERLAKIADGIRRLMTERSANQPVTGAMKQAREAIYPEYRALIMLLNAYALIDADPHRFDQLISILNANIDYTRRHAVGRSYKYEYDDDTELDEELEEDLGDEGEENTQGDETVTEEG